MFKKSTMRTGDKDASRRGKDGDLILFGLTLDHCKLFIPIRHSMHILHILHSRHT